MKKQIRRIILIPLKMIKTLSDCKGMLLSSAVSSMSERVFYVIITFLLSSSILFLKVISAILSKKNPFHSLSGNFTSFICVGFFHTIYLFSLNKIYDLFVVYDLSEIWFQGSTTYKTAIDVSLSKQSGAVAAFTEPPYWIRIAAAVASS